MMELSKDVDNCFLSLMIQERNVGLMIVFAVGILLLPHYVTYRGGDLMSQTDHLQFSPDILRRLGEELVPHVDQGIVELVRNAYDADAVHCLVELIGILQPGGIIRISDDGVGMTESAIRSGWLILGRSGKVKWQQTSKLFRRQVGEKGLGRLAALRLGSKATLITRPDELPGVEYKIEIDWSKYENAETVESIPLRIEQYQTQLSPGSVIEVSGLHSALIKRDIQRLARALLLLADPFENATGFHPRLTAEGFDDIAQRVVEFYFDEASYNLTATADADGSATVTVVDALGNTVFGPEVLRGKPYHIPATTFNLWVFILDKKSFASSTVALSEVQEWLGEVGGVHLYHRGLRVHPYGDQGHDWLEMNLRRAQDPELRPSTNTSIGRIVVEDTHGLLIQKTDRTGFVENETFFELKRFACDALEWMHTQRMKEREDRRQKKRAHIPDELSRAEDEVNRSVSLLPPESRVQVEHAVEKLKKVRAKEASVLKEEVQLYRTLATVGTTAAVFAHESVQPVRRIEKAASEICQFVENEVGLFDRDTVNELSKMIIRSAQSLRTFAFLPLELLKHEKRRIGRVEIHSVINKLCVLLQPFMEDAQINLTFLFHEGVNPIIFGSIAAIESIFANLFTNAAYALMHTVPKPSSCEIKLYSIVYDNDVVFQVLDNGPGIQGISIDDIWLPGKTTKSKGTGLGLTIAKDAVLDLGGTITVTSPGDLGGATFEVTLPIIGEPQR